MASTSFVDRLIDGVVAGIDSFRGRAPVAAAPEPVAVRSGGRLGKKVSGESPYIDRYPRILGPLANPASVSSALRRSELGYMRPLCDLLSEMRETTPHLQAELGKREKSLSGCAWTMTPAETKGLNRTQIKRANKIADDIRGRLDAIDSTDDDALSINGLVDHLAGGNYYGRSGAEIVYQRDARGIGVRKIVPVQPKRFSYAKNWRIHLYDEAGNSDDQAIGTFPGIDIRKEWPDKFIIHEPKTLGAALPTQQGIGRVLVWACLFWKGNARYWLQFMELFANPWRVGSYPKDANAEDIAHLEEALINLSGLATATFREGCKPEFLQVRDTRNFADSHNTWLGEISKVVNGGTLTSSLGGGEGSRAAAEVHEREAYKLVGSDGRAMDATIKRDLVRPLVRLNYGDEAARLLCPTFRLATDPPENRRELAVHVFGLADRGVEIDADEAREKLSGFRKPEKGAPILKPLAAGAISAQPQGDDGEPKGDAETSETEDDKPAKKKPSKDAADVDSAEGDE